MPAIVRFCVLRPDSQALPAWGDFYSSKEQADTPHLQPKFLVIGP
jgi:hypothetical protein